jgi:hypothetical protein
MSTMGNRVQHVQPVRAGDRTGKIQFHRHAASATETKRNAPILPA